MHQHKPSPPTNKKHQGTDRRTNEKQTDEVHEEEDNQEHQADVQQQPGVLSEGGGNRQAAAGQRCIRIVTGLHERNESQANRNGQGIQ